MNVYAYLFPGKVQMSRVSVTSLKKNVMNEWLIILWLSMGTGTAYFLNVVNMLFKCALSKMQSNYLNCWITVSAWKKWRIGNSKIVKFAIKGIRLRNLWLILIFHKKFWDLPEFLMCIAGESMAIILSERVEARERGRSWESQLP